MRWDIFCTVIDNFGDIGVTWRLARQLAAEHSINVRLWVDDLAAFQRIRPEIDPGIDAQTLQGVDIRRWTSPLPPVTPGDVVIEALACTLPDDFKTAMAARNPAPVWINLEYLTAEAWADGVHALPSQHPRLPLIQHFFVPGFSPRTGGLTREAGLPAARDAFRADAAAQARFWLDLRLPPAVPGVLQVSLFSYENAALPGLLDAWANSPRPLRVCVPEGKALAEIAAWLGQPMLRAGDIHLRGALQLCVLPMLDQDAYDRLLWACDLNLVRGEDSFLRAQFAGRPMLWQAYRQDAGAHHAKVSAFLEHYLAALDPAVADTLRMLYEHWNHESPIDQAWPDWLATLPALNAHAQAWAEHLVEMPDLAANLMIFCEKLAKTQGENG
mgnify:CR=1 FL=1